MTSPTKNPNPKLSNSFMQTRRLAMLYGSITWWFMQLQTGAKMVVQCGLNVRFQSVNISYISAEGVNMDKINCIQWALGKSVRISVVVRGIKCRTDQCVSISGYKPDPTLSLFLTSQHFNMRIFLCLLCAHIWIFVQHLLLSHFGWYLLCLGFPNLTHR